MNQNIEKTIKVQSTRFGEAEINVDQILTFPLGIAGFEEHKRWCLLHLEETPDYSWLQSLDDSGVSLLLADPDELFNNYHVHVTEDLLAPLELAEEGEGIPSVVMRVVLKWAENTKSFSANLRAPIIFNLDNRRALQIILQGSQYSMNEEIKTFNAATNEAGTTIEAPAANIAENGEGHAEARI